MPPTQWKNRAKNTAKSDFCGFSTFSVRFGPFSMSWRPGTCLKSFLDAIRFFSTVYEPVATLKTSNRINFYVFWLPFLPTGSSIPTLFVEKRFFDEGSDPPRPIPQDPHQNFAQNDVLASSPSFFLDPFVTKTLFLFQTILSYISSDRLFNSNVFLLKKTFFWRRKWPP